MVKRLTVKDVEYISYKIAKEFMSGIEPIPEFSTRYPGVLESCLVSPFQQIAGQDLYRGIEGKAAILFYFLIKGMTIMK